VLLGDDHNVLSDGLQRLIATNYEVVRALSDRRELVAAAQEKNPT
jgi:DNA-binding NarL/FixJ family response regulator